jgi:hypothetical protein
LFPPLFPFFSLKNKPILTYSHLPERAKLRRASETTLHNTIMKAITLANAHKDHIPPITTTESNPFPYQIHVGGGQQKDSGTATSPAAGGVVGSGAAASAAAAAAGWATRMGIY